jgi:hypothetical protein
VDLKLIGSGQVAPEDSEHRLMHMYRVMVLPHDGSNLPAGKEVIATATD